MEYGFLFFSIIVFWIVSDRFYEMLSEDKYRTITNFLSNGTLVVQAGIAVFENPAFQSLVGQSAIGYTIEDLSTRIAKGDKQKFLQYYDSLMNSGNPERSTTVRIEKNGGEESVIEINAKAIRYKAGIAFLAVLRDITERIREEKDRRENEEKIGRLKKKEVMDFNRIVKTCVGLPEHKKLLMFHPQVAVETDLESQLLNIKGSAIHFGKAVINLVSNAAETIAGRGRVVVSTANRCLESPLKGYRTIPEGEYAVLTVKDNGPGMDQETLDRLLEPFYTKKVMGRSGTCLGLTLVWNVIQDHGASLDIISNDQGTCFEIYCHTIRETPADKRFSPQATHFSGRGERVLAVDDVKSQREIVCQLLNMMGYSTDAVSSGEAAIDYVRLNEGKWRG